MRALDVFIQLAALTLAGAWLGYLVVQRVVHGRRLGLVDAALTASAALLAAGAVWHAGWLGVAGGALAAGVAVLLARAAVRRGRAP